MSEKIEPCPFCGIKPRVYEAGGGAWVVACQGSGTHYAEVSEGPNKSAAIAAWNRRAPDPRLSAAEEARKAVASKEFRAWLADVIGEGVHTGLRKACDSKKAHDVWTAIRDLKDWKQAVIFAAEGIAPHIPARLAALPPDGGKPGLIPIVVKVTSDKNTKVTPAKEESKSGPGLIASGLDTVYEQSKSGPAPSPAPCGECAENAALFSGPLSTCPRCAKSAEKK